MLCISSIYLNIWISLGYSVYDILIMFIIYKTQGPENIMNNIIKIG